MKLRHRTLAYLVAGLLVVACAASAEAQGRRGGGQGGPGGGPGGPGGRGGFGGFGGGAMFGANPELTLLRRTDVRKEIDLLDDQVKQLETLAEGLNFRDAMAGLGDLPQEERMAKARSVMEDMQKKAQQKVDEILLPHQAKRLKQLAFQFQMQNRGGLTSDTVAEQVGISEEQRTELRNKARKMQQEFQKKLQDELLKDLTPAQQGKIKELVGEPFQFDPEENAAMFGGRGGRGGAGGPGAPGGRNPGGRRGGGGRGN